MKLRIRPARTEQARRSRSILRFAGLADLRMPKGPQGIIIRIVSPHLAGHVLVTSTFSLLQHNVCYATARLILHRILRPSIEVGLALRWTRGLELVKGGSADFSSRQKRVYIAEQVNRGALSLVSHAKAIQQQDATL